MKEEKTVYVNCAFRTIGVEKTDPETGIIFRQAYNPLGDWKTFKTCGTIYSACGFEYECYKNSCRENGICPFSVLEDFKKINTDWPMGTFLILAHERKVE